MPLEAKLRLWVIGAYLMTRNWRWLLAAMIVIGVVVGGWGSLEASTPAATDSGGSQVPIWRLLAVGSGLLPVLTLASPLQALEAAAGLPYHRTRCFVLWGALAISSACILTAATVGMDVAVAPVIVRALLAWFGLALVSGRVLAWSYSWVLPSAVMCVLLYWGHDRTGRTYRWWEFTAHPVGHLPSMVLAGILLTAGLTAYALSPWRIHRVTQFLRGVRGS
ncbi:hypothetical protein [Micromonospora sagamiensis]|uniref:Uncharacterized protein n=1 Tax=Micromonospora sagamiensis TaxID=47875 RepID=A0A562WM96_9ACTN|nr:hypothetical protein [Micromonospora sagamiensis]TWJ31181.1 hypothetical protein JD81_04735 [Micromonospora sagamiensis]BCL15774.1 hypothetical protein GCM10017556_35130 [Micromonospora sagamiensis]